MNQYNRREVNGNVSVGNDRNGNRADSNYHYGQNKKPKPLRFENTAHRKSNWFTRALMPCRNIYKHYNTKGTLNDITGVYFGWDFTKSVNYVEVTRQNDAGVDVSDNWEWLTQNTQLPPKEDKELCTWYITDEESPIV